MKKGLAMLLVLGVVAQEGWAFPAKCEDVGKSKTHQKGKKENKANTDGK